MLFFLSFYCNYYFWGFGNIIFFSQKSSLLSNHVLTFIWRELIKNTNTLKTNLLLIEILSKIRYPKILLENTIWSIKVIKSDEQSRSFFLCPYTHVSIVLTWQFSQSEFKIFPPVIDLETNSIHAVYYVKILWEMSALQKVAALFPEKEKFIK